jgi:hypothetical protein
VARPHAGLHLEVLLGIAVVIGALYFICVPHVPVVGLYTLPGLEAMGLLVQKNLQIIPLTGGVGSTDPHQIPRQNVNPEFVPQGRLPRILMRCKGGTFLHYAEVGPVDRHQAVIAHVMGTRAAVASEGGR